MSHAHAEEDRGEHDHHGHRLTIGQPAVRFTGPYSWPLATSPLYDLFDPATRTSIDGAYALRHLRTGRAVRVDDRRSVAVRPPILARFRPPRRVVVSDADGADVEVTALLHIDQAVETTAPVSLALRAGDAILWSHELAPSKPGERLIPVRLELPSDPLSLELALESDGPVPVTATGPLGVTLLDARVPRSLSVGVVRSYDDTLEGALADLGVETRRLTADDLAFRDLSSLDAILIGIRAYRVRDDLVRFNQRLLDYAEAGGVLVTFYQKTAEWNASPSDPDRSYAPYPLQLTRKRVVDEQATVTLLQPRHRLLSTPNRIGLADFDGWVHERGLYFPHKSYDERYVELLSCADVGEPALPGGLLVARHGKGWYVYTAYGWYRQWLAGVPGAYRLLANLVSLGRPDGDGL